MVPLNQGWTTLHFKHTRANPPRIQQKEVCTLGIYSAEHRESRCNQLKLGHPVCVPEDDYYLKI